MSYAIQLMLMTHEGGTKYYELIQIKNLANGKTILVKRWGKSRTAGQLKLEPFDTVSSSYAEWSKTIEYRQKRGYTEDRTQTFEASTWKEATGKLPLTVLDHLEQVHLAHLGADEGTPIAAAVEATKKATAPKEEKPKHPDWASW